MYRKKGINWVILCIERKVLIEDIMYRKKGIEKIGL